MAEVRQMPAHMLFQCEVMADALDRVARRQHLEAVNTAAHAAAMRKLGLA